MDMRVGAISGCVTESCVLYRVWSHGRDSRGYPGVRQALNHCQHPSSSILGRRDGSTVRGWRRRPWWPNSTPYAYVAEVGGNFWLFLLVRPHWQTRRKLGDRRRGPSDQPIRLYSQHGKCQWRRLGALGTHCGTTKTQGSQWSDHPEKNEWWKLGAKREDLDLLEIKKTVQRVPKNLVWSSSISGVHTLDIWKKFKTPIARIAMFWPWILLVFWGSVRSGHNKTICFKVPPVFHKPRSVNWRVSQCEANQPKTWSSFLLMDGSLVTNIWPSGCKFLSFLTWGRGNVFRFLVWVHKPKFRLARSVFPQLETRMQLRISLCTFTFHDSKKKPL